MRLALVVALSAAGACTSARSRSEVVPAAPPRPPACAQVAPGADLAAVVEAAADGDALCLAAGEHLGPIVIRHRIALWGPRDAVVRARAGGSVVTVAASGATVRGFTIDASGGRFDAFDAAVHVVADDVVVEAIAVEHSVYGILVERAHRVTVRGNHIRGDAGTAIGLRGDTIRLWEVRESVVERNLVEDGRDIVVWYSPGNRVIGNRVVRGRYGTHLMYSHDTVVADNRYVDPVVGMFVMYCRGVTLRGNLVVNARGAASLAIGLKDSGNLRVEDNVLVHDSVGIYVDQTPGQVGDTLIVRDNVVRQCDVAVAFHTTPRATEIVGNDFADDRQLLRAEGGIETAAATWRGNYFDGYAGYDLDGDGIGDLPHEARDASEELIANHPPLAFFRGSAAMGLVDIASALMPLWTPRRLLVDPAPRMTPRDTSELADAR